MIELFTRPADYPFLRMVQKINDDGSRGVISLDATQECTTFLNADDETILDLMSTIEVREWPLDIDVGSTSPDLFKLFSASNDIARQTRRGVGNVCIVSPETMCRIDTETWTKFHERRMVSWTEIPEDEAWLFYIGRGTMFNAVDSAFGYNEGTLRVHPYWQKYCARIVL